MVKNINGGSGHKRQAKDRGAYTDYKITSDLEIEAYVERIIGNGRLLVNSIDGRYAGLICTIRGKFSGRNKSKNKIDTNSIVIIGLREWEEPTYKTCDLLSVTKQTFIIDEEHISRDDIIVFSNHEDTKDLNNHNDYNANDANDKDHNNDNDNDNDKDKDTEIDFDDI